MFCRIESEWNGKKEFVNRLSIHSCEILKILLYIILCPYLCLQVFIQHRHMTNSSLVDPIFRSIKAETLFCEPKVDLMTEARQSSYLDHN